MLPHRCLMPGLLLPLVLSGGWLCSAVCHVAIGAEARDYSSAIELLEAAVRYECELKSLPAFSIGLVAGDRLVWSRGFGFQDAEKTVHATADTVYRVGSVSKLFTDLAVMQLVEQDKLKLDAPLADYLPSFRPKNPYGNAITTRQLMSHQSGLVREPPVGHYFDPSQPTLAETVSSLNETTLVYPPASRTKYSNAAVAVVGSVLEAIVDRSHPEHVREMILGPLEMSHSGFTVNESMRPRLASGWMRTQDGRRFAAPDFQLGTGPAGNLYASVNDLSKFLIWLLDDNESAPGPSIGRDTIRTMIQPVRNAEGEPQTFGIGFHIQQLDRFLKIGHGGAVYGFSTQLEALPERHVGVAAVASLDGTNGVVRRLADYALRLMLASQDGKSLPSYRETRPIAPERSGRLRGRYRQLDGEQEIKITVLNEDVLMHRGTFRHRLRAAADDGTILIDDPIAFGTVVQLMAGGQQLMVGDQRFQRLPEQPPAACPSRWQGLIGEYGWDHNTLYILEKQGTLYALIEWFYYYPLEEIDHNHFRFPDYGLYHGEGLTFSRDADGVATSVEAAEVVFQRRAVGTRNGETFQIQPVRPIDELRRLALKAKPPEEQGPFRRSKLIQLTQLDPSIRLDIRYATTNNFMGAVFYKQPRAFMQQPAAEAVVHAHQRLAQRGLGLLIFDAYRPWHVTKMFWDATPADLKDFVANPDNGSRHNRGCAVDLTLFDRASGQPVEMVAGYDEFSPRSFPLYPGGTGRQRWHRDLLRRTMEREGFRVYQYEWWHFDYQDWKKYRIGNATFEEILYP